jgi:hypothetical protein
VQESELLRDADEWWGKCDFQTMERITGYRQHDFDPEDGCQAFVDACNGWWNGKTAEEKIGIRFDRLSGGGETSDAYVLVEFPEGASYFENGDIGYPCFISKDNGARYVPVQDYVAHFGRNPARDILFRPLRWPESQNWLHRSDKRCEIIMAYEKALRDFGGAAVWVPVSLLNGENTVPASEYGALLEEVRNKFAAEIAEADANPDKWYEVFVTDGSSETHTEAVGDTFDEAVGSFGRIADQWGLDNTHIDIWENGESPMPVLGIK